MRVRVAVLFAFIHVVSCVVCRTAGVAPYALHAAAINASHPPAEDLLWYSWEPSLASVLVASNAEQANLTTVQLTSRLANWTNNTQLRNAVLNNSASDTLASVVGFSGKDQTIVQAYLYGAAQLLVAYRGLGENELPRSYNISSAFAVGFNSAVNNCSGGVFWGANESLIIDGIHNVTVQHAFFPVFNGSIVVGVVVWVILIPEVQLRILTTQTVEQTQMWKQHILPVFLRHYPNTSFEFDSVPIYALDSALQQGAASPSDMTFCLPYTTSSTVLQNLPNFNVTYDNVSHDAWSHRVNQSDTYYCLPVAAVNHGYFYNKDVFTRLNLSIPTTMTEFHTVLDAISKFGNGTIPLALNLLLVKDSLWDSLNGNFREGEIGRDMLQAGTLNFKSAPFVSTFAELAHWAKQGWLSRDWLTQTKSECIEEWVLGHAAIIGTSSADLGDLTGLGAFPSPQFRWGVFPPPRADQAKDCYVVKELDFAIGMLKTSPNRNEALAFLQWLTTTEFIDLMEEWLPGYFPLVSTARPMNMSSEPMNEMTSWAATCKLTMKLGTEGPIGSDMGGFQDEIFDLSQQVMTEVLTPEAAAAQLYSQYRYSEHNIIDINLFFQHVLLIFTALHAIVIIATAIVITVYRNITIIRSSSYPMVLTSLVGAFAVVLSCNLYSASPSDSVCGAKTWLTPYFLIVAFGPLFLKQWRVHVIFKSADTQAHATVNTDKELATGIVALLMLQTLIQLVAILIDGPSHLIFVPVGRDFVQIQCSETSIADGGSLVLQIAMYGVGAIIAFRARNLPSQFNETRSHFICLLTITFYCLFCLPLAWYIKSYPTVAAMLKAGGLFIGGLICYGVLFGPKLHAIYREVRKKPGIKEDDLSGCSGDRGSVRRNNKPATTLITSTSTSFNPV